MTIRAGARLDATDFTLPDVVTGYGAGTNTVTATSFAALPTTTCSASITNPHPTAAMLVLVSYGAWMSASANGIRAALAISGATTIAAGIGGGAAVGWGEILYEGANGVSVHHSAVFTVELPASVNAAVFATHSYRDAAEGSQTCNYPTIRIIPIRFVF